MTLGAIAAVICIVIAVIVGVTEEKILFGVTDWLIAAIPCALLGGPVVFKKGAS